MGDLLGELAATVEPMARAKAIALAVDDACRLRAHADRGKVQQIILNLLSNAVKFTDDGGRIDVGCTDGDGAVRITVRDTGRGIPPDRIASIFDPFVQVDQHEDSKLRQGVGLGLAIARELARGMGGEITVASAVGEGSTFTLVSRRSSPRNATSGPPRVPALSSAP